MTATHRACILVVDDEPDLRETFATHLRFVGHQVYTAADGEEALRELRLRRFDVVVTDLRMPRMDGVELLRRLRGEQPLVRVIVVSGHVTLTYAMDCLRHGADTVLSKPLQDLGELERAVEQACATLARWTDLLRRLQSHREAGDG